MATRRKGGKGELPQRIAEGLALASEVLRREMDVSKNNGTPKMDGL